MRHPGHTPSCLLDRRLRLLALTVVLPLGLAVSALLTRPAEAEPQPVALDGRPLTIQQIADHAKTAWDNGAMSHALDLLDHGLHEYPRAALLHTLRGDILAASRRQTDALEAYDRALSAATEHLGIRWSKWSLLLRGGRTEEAMAELQHIAQLDSHNPVVHLRVAQELRKLDRLEESLEAYQRAVSLAPDLLSWRLGLARARFDLLDYVGAETDIQYVLDRLGPDSPLEAPAQNLLTALYTSQDRGRRFEPQATTDASPAQLKEWADTRSEAWQLYSSGHFPEAEPVLRRALALNPQDPTATHQLGVTLMQLGRCKEAIPMFRRMSGQNPNEDTLADALFRMGQCLVEQEQWEDAFVQFHMLYSAALEFEEANKGVAFPPDTRILDKTKLARWLDTVRPHVAEFAKAVEETAGASALQAAPPRDQARSADALVREAMEKLKPQRALDARTSLLGRDTDFSWFRFVVPASKVVRDDSPTGAHEFIPIQPADTFPATQSGIYVVFAVVTASYDEVPLSARCFLETTETAQDAQPVTNDRVVMSMNDQSGYFLLTPPPGGWTSGLYRCGLYAGERTSAYNHVDEVRFRIVDPPRHSSSS